MSDTIVASPPLNWASLAAVRAWLNGVHTRCMTWQASATQGESKPLVFVHKLTVRTVEKTVD